MSGNNYKFLSDEDDSQIKEEHVEESKPSYTINPRHLSHHVSQNYLAKYAMERLNRCDKDVHFPVPMHVIINFIEEKYQKKALATELTFAMIELCLKVPIQLDLEVEGFKIDINEANIEYNSHCFVNAFMILSDLLKAGIIKPEMLRDDVRIKKNIS